MVKRMDSRAMSKRHRQGTPETPLIPLGSHFTLTYRQLDTGEEHFSSVMEIVSWIELGPLLLPPPTPLPDPTDDLPITTPSYVPASLQYVPIHPHPSVAHIPMTAEQRVPTISVEIRPQRQNNRQRNKGWTRNPSDDPSGLPGPLLS